MPNVMDFWIVETVDVTLARVGPNLDESLAILATKPWTAYQKTLGFRQKQIDRYANPSLPPSLRNWTRRSRW